MMRNRNTVQAHQTLAQRRTNNRSRVSEAVECFLMLLNSGPDTQSHTAVAFLLPLLTFCTLEDIRKADAFPLVVRWQAAEEENG